MDKKKKIAILLIAVAVILVAIMICLYSCGGPEDTGETRPTSQTTSEGTTAEPTGTEPTTVPTTPATTTPETEPTGETQPTKPVKPSNPQKPTEPQPTEPAKPVLTEPNQVLTLAKEKLKALPGNSQEVSAVINPQKLTVAVSGTDAVDTAAQAVVDQIKDALDYSQGKADPNVAVGSPNPFTYDYTLTYVNTENDQHVFLLEYRFVSVNYQVPGQNYTTNQMVTDICAYLTGLGKTKIDSQTEGGRKQVVIVPVEHSYETALEIVKAQVENVTRDSRNFDFYYVGLTVTTKGGQEQTALCFYIINK